MQQDKLITYIFVLSVFLLISSCSARKSTPLEGPVPLEDPNVKNGQILFMEHCQRCHPMGEAGLGLAINSNPAPSFLKRYQVRHGLGVMPSFEEDQITDEELDDILQFLKVLQGNED